MTTYAQRTALLGKPDLTQEEARVLVDLAMDCLLRAENFARKSEPRNVPVYTECHSAWVHAYDARKLLTTQL